MKVFVCIQTIIAFVASTVTMATPTNGLENVADRHDSGRVVRDKNKTAEFYEQQIATTNIGIVERIAVLHNLAKIYSSGAKHGDSNNIKAVQCYHKMFEISGGRVNRDIVIARCNMADAEAQTSSELIRRRWLFVLWTIEQLVDADTLKTRVLVDENASDATRERVALEVGRMIIELQDTIVESLFDMRNNGTADPYIRSVQETLLPLLSGAYETKRSRERVQQLEWSVRGLKSSDSNVVANAQRPANSKETVVSVPTNIELTQTQANIRAIRKKWADENPDKMAEIKAFNIRLPDLMMTQAGKKEAVAWLEGYDKLWLGSPLENETRLLIKKLKEPENMK